MEKAVDSRPVSEEDEALSCSKKPRSEASPGSEDTEKYTLFTDSEYKLPLYLSEFAVGEFNNKKKASYENVNVVKTMKSSDVEKARTTYLITFEASLCGNKGKNVRTFQASIFMSTLETTAKIKIKFVRMMPSGLECNEKEELEEKESESMEEGSEEEGESEEELPDESDDEDNEEELNKSDEEDTEESLDVRKTVWGKSPWQEIKQIDIEVEKSDKEGSEAELSDESDEEDTEEKLSESDEKDTRRKTFGGKGPRTHPKHDEEMKQYCIDLEKSDGFEVGIYPHMSRSCCMTRCYYDPPHRIISAASLNELVHLSQLAICVYNMKEVTSYDNVKVLKAMDSGCGGRTYKITFEASLSDRNATTFQAKIWASLPFQNPKIEIDFVRIKPSTDSPEIAK